jgi:hypothetical protein
VTTSSSDAAASRGASTIIRPAGIGDLPAIRDLLSMRDSRQWDDVSTRWFMRGLDPELCLGWLALAGDRPVAFCNVYLRELRCGQESLRAGYWANLFIDSAYRDRLLYPRLPMAILADAPRHRLSFIYMSVRLPELATAHTRLGVVKLGKMRVLAKPLRPTRLLAKHYRLPIPSGLADPADGLYGAWLELTRGRAPVGLTVEEVDPGGSTVEAVVHRLVESSRDRIADRWTPESFRLRYRQTREGTRYFMLVTRSGDEVIGAVIFRLAERDAGIQAGVVMDVVVLPGREKAIVPSLLEAERRARAAGADLMIFLDGLGPGVSGAMRSIGYLGTPEAYELMVWPKQALAEHPLLADAALWRMGFGDHDAF